MIDFHRYPGVHWPGGHRAAMRTMNVVLKLIRTSFNLGSQYPTVQSMFRPEPARHEAAECVRRLGEGITKPIESS